jgi:hypothetical protein
MSSRTLSPLTRRIVIVSAAVGTIMCAGLIVAMTWAILWIHHDRARFERVPAEIVSVNKSNRSAFGRGIHFGAYLLTIRYRDPDGKEVTDWVEKRTYGFPSAGDSFTVLIDPESGHIEASPFPELWILLILVCAGLGWLIRFFVIFFRWALRQ